MTAHGFSFALVKNEVVILTRRRIPTQRPTSIVELTIESRPAVKYLGLMLDSKMKNRGWQNLVNEVNEDPWEFSYKLVTRKIGSCIISTRQMDCIGGALFPRHPVRVNVNSAESVEDCLLEQIKAAAGMAAAGVAALNRLMANVGGPISTRKRLLIEATQSVLLYGAEVWADALDKEVHRKRLAQQQRRGALRVASAYRTISEPAVMVIARVIPVDLLAKERKAIYSRKGENLRKVVARVKRQRTLTEWQLS